MAIMSKGALWVAYTLLLIILTGATLMMVF